MIAKVPKGNYVLIKGDPGDANAKTFLPMGWDQAGLKDKVASGDIKIIGPADGTYTDGWKTEKAQANMEAIIDAANAANQKIDAVLAENDSTALGVAAALDRRSRTARIPLVSGQDGDPANLNNLALGQAVRRRLEEQQRARQGGRPGSRPAVQGQGSREGHRQRRRLGRAGRRQHRHGLHDPGRQQAQVDHPQADADHSRTISDKVISAGWYVTKEQICEGVDTAKVPATASSVRVTGATSLV